MMSFLLAATAPSAPSVEDALIVLGAVVFWVAAYVMMTRRGLMDKSYGLPISVLCLNIPWEVYYGFIADSNVEAHAVAIIYLVPDLAVLWTCLKYGPDDFESPLMKGGFYRIAAFGMIVGSIAIWGFHDGFEDTFGAITATFTTTLSMIMLLAMLMRRNNVKGQTVYIGICLILGNICGWLQTLAAQESIQSNIPILWTNVAYGIILVTGLIYVSVFIRVCRRDGIDPWTRW